MSQKATARPPANSPAFAVVPEAAAAAATLPSLCQQLREVLPPRRLHSVSLCDRDANVLWLSEGALGPDEHSAVVEALEILAADTSTPCHELGLEDGRHALFLPVRAPMGTLLGIAMILADCKSVGDDTVERLTAGPVRVIMQRLAVLLKPSRRSGDTHAGGSGAIPVLELAAESVIVSGPATPGARAPEAAPPIAAKAISPEQVNDMLELELLPAEAPPARAARLNGSATPAQGESSSRLPGLEIMEDAPAAPPKPPRAARKSTAPARPAAPAVAQAPVSDANLILEVLPFAKLRAGGQTRRFQVLARSATRTAQRDPAALDALILQKLLGWLAAHRAEWNSQPTSFTVNLSIATLEDERFVHKIAAALNEHAIAAETLGFEIAEALCTQHRARVERFITQCEKLGVWVVIEDFSFDSQVLPLLRSTAVRLVKIDPKLTSSALKDKLSQALVVATVQAAKVMGIHCAAKRVDSQAALQWLTAIGCDFAQGAALSSAQPLEALANAPDPTSRVAAVRSM
ncbi:MAG: EAL domain-containing protein [Gammaproteobacteria bacterium]|nr:MAG: EAL domain-containing protein [Gammaproteobacteria bacterium]TLY84457.1 MAG: EAL domain-containing protein [Gammaproteobacteria bacterium]